MACADQAAQWEKRSLYLSVEHTLPTTQLALDKHNSTISNTSYCWHLAVPCAATHYFVVGAAPADLQGIPYKPQTSLALVQTPTVAPVVLPVQ
jgi:hypothetical protein